MKRRAFLGALGGAAVWPLAARAQQAERVRHIAILIGPAEADVEARSRLDAFRKGLRASGWIEGENVKIETRWGAGNPAQIQAHAQALVNSAPDVIFANSTPVTAALKRATASIPIVFAVVTDPIGDGFVASLSRPGGNITGFSSFDSEIGGKWVEILKEIAPRVTHAALLFNPRTVPGGGTGGIRPFVDAAARKLSIELLANPVESTAAIESALTGHARQANSGLIAMPDSFITVNSALVIRLAERLRLPTIYPFRFFVDAGGLVSYGVDTVDLNLRAASYVDRILKGAKPADLPIQTPTRFELAINLKVAKSLGLIIPPSLLARADIVVD